MSKNPLLEVPKLGQSVWLDQLSRGLLLSGGLRRLIEDDGLRGVTTNPKIFHEAIAESDDYDGAIAALAQRGLDVEGIYQSLTVGDVQLAADELGELHEASGGDHGFVSLEVNPHLAYRTDATVQEARRLWKAVDRPNVFIKVPATEPGLEAIRTLIGEGINVNVTLLFGLPRYRRVAEAYLAGLEDRAAAGRPIHSVRSVASFFLSRIDVLVDGQLEALMDSGGEKADLAGRLHGKVAVASARQAYQIYRELFGGRRFQALKAQGAAPQRVLWASTSTKNPDYSDVKYVEALIGPETVNTLPMETLKAYRDHGRPEARLEKELDEAEKTLAALPQVGVDLDRVTAQLEREGVEKFNRPYDSLLATLARRRSEDVQAAAPKQCIEAGEHAAACEERLLTLGEDRFGERLLRRDPSPWGDAADRMEQIAGSLGWLGAPAALTDRLAELLGLSREIQAAGFTHVVHMGMGGSSLAPLVLERTFGTGENGLPLRVLDTTDARAVAAVTEEVPLESTLFVVASKSGTTTEPLDFASWFLEKVKEKRGDEAGRSFLAITDPGSPLVDQARRQGWRRTLLNFTDVGGRYSALTWFGLAPAVLAGIDVAGLLARALAMHRACETHVPLRKNPGVALGATLGELARRGRDKVTFITPPGLETFGMWLEQLLAESTGKEGHGLLPVAGEPLGAPEDYGKDRVFVRLRYRADVDPLDDAVEKLAQAGHPVITHTLHDKLDLGAEFVRWEIAVATAGRVLGINPFDQPNVQESKDKTKELLRRLAEKGELPREKPDVEADGLQIHGAEGASDPASALDGFLSRAEAGDYLAVLAYLPPDPATDRLMDELRVEIRRLRKVATTFGYGPRYLHSTGQLHKGGPDTGLFLMLTAEQAPELPVPGRDYDFHTLQTAQAVGDLQALRSHGRRVLRVHLTGDVAEGLERLRRAVHRSAEARA